MFIFLLFYIGIAQSFQPTYYSGFKPFFQLSRKDKKIALSSDSIHFVNKISFKT